MEFKEIEQIVLRRSRKYCEENNIDFNKDVALIKLYEELGEFSQAILIHNKKCRADKYLPEEISKEKLAMEIGDVMGLLIVNAHLLGIDLEKAVIKKWTK